MAAKKRSRKRAGLVWRVLFGQHGPTRKALKKTLADLVGPKTIVSISRDPKTGRLVTKNLVVDKRTGVITIAPKKPAKKAAAKMSSASRASKPSRMSRAGQVQKRTTAAPRSAQPQPRQPRAKTMPERVEGHRNPDGTLRGSAPAVDPAIKAAREYERIMRDVARLRQQTDRDLGWGPHDYEQ